MIAQTNRQFQVVETEEAPSEQGHDVAAQMMALALKALSQKALVALASLFTLAVVASVFTLYWSVLPNPSVLQLVGLGAYSAFVLAVLFIRRK